MAFDARGFKLMADETTAEIELRNATVPTRSKHGEWGVAARRHLVAADAERCRMASGTGFAIHRCMAAMDDFAEP